MTAQSKVYREEQQEYAPGDRIRMTEPGPPQGFRKGDFATIAAIGEAGGLEVQLDKGPTLQLTKEQARHIEYGYAVDSLKTGAPERVLISQESSRQAAPEVAYLTRTGREVSLYTSDGSVQQNAQSPSIASPELKQSMPVPEQQQTEAPANVMTAGQEQTAHHRHSHGR